MDVKSQLCGYLVLLSTCFQSSLGEDVVFRQPIDIEKENIATFGVKHKIVSKRSLPTGCWHCALTAKMEVVLEQTPNGTLLVAPEQPPNVTFIDVQTITENVSIELVTPPSVIPITIIPISEKLTTTKLLLGKPDIITPIVKQIKTTASVLKRANIFIPPLKMQTSIQPFKSRDNYTYSREVKVNATVKPKERTTAEGGVKDTHREVIGQFETFSEVKGCNTLFCFILQGYRNSGLPM